MTRIKRRSFLEGTIAATAIATVPQLAFGSCMNKIVVGVIGNGGQGRSHVSSFVSQDVEVAYVCDVDESRRAEAQKLAPSAKAVSDLRTILDDPNVDAVSIATPDHWHTPAALLALEAGKHVYVEKPCSHNVREGRLLISAMERSGKFVQHGTQSRSAPFLQYAVKLLREGIIGDVIMAKAWNVQVRPPIGKQQPSAPPGGFDYDTWLGPAPLVPFQANRHHYNWHWWYHFGTGDAGNDGVHEIDIARWGLDVHTHPKRIAAIGGKYVYDDDQEFPDTMTAVFEYDSTTPSLPKRQLTFEMRLWSKQYPFNIDNGNEFLGTKGRMLLTKRGKLEVYNENREKVDLKLPEDMSVSVANHQKNFLDTIRGAAKLNADANEGHLSSTLPHLANLACRLSKNFEFDPATEKITNDQEANKYLGREYRPGHWGAPKV